MSWSIRPFSAWAIARRFGQALAAHYLATRPSAGEDRTGSKTRLLLLNMRAQVERFTRSEKVTFFSKALMANDFKWGLIEGGVDRAKADEMTEWLLQEVSRHRK